jgi:phosphatidylinositol glycan class S
MLIQLVTALIGIPIWLWTTSIYRAPLNYDEMDFYDHNIQSQILVRVPVYLNIDDRFPDLALATQLLVDKELHQKNVRGWTIDVIQGPGPRGGYNVEFTQGDEEVFAISEYTRDVMIGYSLDLVAVGRVPELVAGVLLDHLFKEEIDMIQSHNNAVSSKVVAYSPNYHLTFSLFHGGGDPIEWDISESLNAHFAPLKDDYSRISNLSVDTQIQYYASVGCSLHKENDEWTLDHDDLSTFVNFAEWSLTSIHSYPTLHFILYIPSKDQSPMVIKHSHTNSFVIPQWGGVMIFNTESTHLTSDVLLPILETFSSQFLGLVGAPSVPKSPPLRLDIISRLSTVRALVAASSTLGSLHRLSQSLPNIAIPHPVLYAVNDALSAIKGSLESLKGGNWDRAIKLAGDALQKSESAFFDKMMVQQAFFPEEHKVAIYLPLLGPIGVVLLMGTNRCWKEYKQMKS